MTSQQLEAEIDAVLRGPTYQLTPDEWSDDDEENADISVRGENGVEIIRMTENQVRALSGWLDAIHRIGFPETMTLAQVAHVVDEKMAVRQKRLDRDYGRTIAKQLDGLLPMEQRRRFYSWLERQGYLQRVERYGNYWKEPTDKALAEGFAREFSSDKFVGVKWANMAQLLALYRKAGAK